MLGMMPLPKCAVKFQDQTADYVKELSRNHFLISYSSVVPLQYTARGAQQYCATLVGMPKRDNWANWIGKLFFGND